MWAINNKRAKKTRYKNRKHTKPEVWRYFAHQLVMWGIGGSGGGSIIGSYRKENKLLKWWMSL